MVWGSGLSLIGGDAVLDICLLQGLHCLHNCKQLCHVVVPEGAQTSGAAAQAGSRGPEHTCQPCLGATEAELLVWPPPHPTLNRGFWGSVSLGRPPGWGRQAAWGPDSLLPLTGILVQLHFLSGDQEEDQPAAQGRLRGPSEDHADENHS